jgi:hypothetical protein
MVDRCVKACLAKVEAIGLAVEAIRSDLDADLEDLRERLMKVDMVKLKASSTRTTTE